MHKYASTEVSLDMISNLSFEELGQRPFQWLEAIVAILTVNDLVLDVGTGCGKSLCFSLPVFLKKSDTSMTVLPLMIDATKLGHILPSHALKRPVWPRFQLLQIVKRPYLEQALRSSTRYNIKYFQSTWNIVIYNILQDIVQGTFHQVIVLSEFATSAEFHRAVTFNVLEYSV